jgi:hypothetical protein
MTLILIKEVIMKKKLVLVVVTILLGLSSICLADEFKTELITVSTVETVLSISNPNSTNIKLLSLMNSGTVDIYISLGSGSYAAPLSEGEIINFTDLSRNISTLKVKTITSTGTLKVFAIVR